MYRHNYTWKSQKQEILIIHLTSSTCTWLRGVFPLLFCGFDGCGLWLCDFLSILFLRLLQKFFTSLSVLPSKYVAILAHLFPNCACNSITSLSSSSENLHPLPSESHTSQNFIIKKKGIKFRTSLYYYYKLNHIVYKIDPSTILDIADKYGHNCSRDTVSETLKTMTLLSQLRLWTTIIKTKPCPHPYTNTNTWTIIVVALKTYCGNQLTVLNIVPTCCYNHKISTNTINKYKMKSGRHEIEV